MSQSDLIVHCAGSEPVSFPTKSSMKKYLDKEGDVWLDFLTQLQSNPKNIAFKANNNRTISAHSLASVFVSLSENLDDLAAFNNITSNRNGASIAPPVSTSIEGQLILGLHENGHKEQALDVYIASIATPLGIPTNTHGINARIPNGRRLLDSAYVAQALPFQNVSSKKLAGAARSAESHAESLALEVVNAKAKIEALDKANKEFSVILDARLKNQSNDFIALTNKLTDSFEEQLEKNDKQAKTKDEQADARHKSIQRAAFNRFKEQKSKFDHLLDLFHTQLTLKSPVELWTKRAAAHRKASVVAFLVFSGLSIFAIALALCISFFGAGEIASYFFEEYCPKGAPSEATCERVFSVRGPLTISGLFLMFSVLLWTIRLQYKIFLSERHLGLDASEKQAFAATFLALQEGRLVEAGSEAIVLSSLFRPTQDGIIRDDESGLDLSAVSILAKQLSR